MTSIPSWSVWREQQERAPRDCSAWKRRIECPVTIAAAAHWIASAGAAIAVVEVASEAFVAVVVVVAAAVVYCSPQTLPLERDSLVAAVVVRIVVATNNFGGSFAHCCWALFLTSWSLLLKNWKAVGTLIFYYRSVMLAVESKRGIVECRRRLFRHCPSTSLLLLLSQLMTLLL